VQQEPQVQPAKRVFFWPFAEDQGRKKTVLSTEGGCLSQNRVCRDTAGSKALLPKAYLRINRMNRNSSLLPLHFLLCFTLLNAVFLFFFTVFIQILSSTFGL
jgi:hypothetical protein